MKNILISVKMKAMEIVLATRNRKKVEEISRMLEGMDIKLLTLDNFPDCPEVEEDAGTFEGNARKKAIAISRCTCKMAVSDDSGLEVFSLNGAPGVLSARYAGPDADDAANNKKLITEMEGISPEERGARFVCVIALSYPQGDIYTFEGTVEGRIGECPAGARGFGYDPLFYPKGSDRTFAEMSPDEKDALSHRNEALKKLGYHIKSHTF